MRRATLALALFLAVTSAGCAGADGQKAQELLAQSDAALAQVESFRFAGRMWMETPVGDFTFVLRGGGNTKDGGSSFMTVQSPDVPEFPEVSVVMRGTDGWMKAGGGWQQIPLPPNQPTGIEQFDLTPYVKDVEVDETATVSGEPAVKITGVFDTSGLVQGMLGQLGSATGGSLPDLSESFGDSRVVIYISEVSHLPLRTLLDLTIDAAGEKAAMHFDFAITDVNEPVRLPGPAA